MSSPTPLPDLAIPPSQSTVSVSAINTTGTIRGLPAGQFFEPKIEGHDYIAAPIYAFLIKHPTLNRSLLWDLGMRKDWQNMSPFLLNALMGGFPDVKLDVPKDVHEILTENGVDANRVEGIIWSHFHFDHVGDPSTFGPRTKLIVGPGVQGAIFPGWPKNQQSPILETDYTGREVLELDFESGNGGTFKTLQIGRFKALDYFGDGSFYLLDSPGHAVGHLCALGRVKSSTEKNSFVFLAGDAIHHVGEIRPSKYLPLPENISPSPFAPVSSGCSSSCPGSIFQSLIPHPEGRTSTTFYEPSRLDPEASFHHDVDELLVTVSKVQEADCQDEILVCAAHDESLLEVIDFFPNGTLDDFAEKGWAKQAKWRFLRDFAKAVDRECEGDVKFPNEQWGPR
ncbi:hypothetical protein QBC35DRAFT_498135 [Podospora australis]|uniref:Metallo-beta-lactamase domain-containing protein n=1 Tax=Podospora australis TaxID=1536484 RepID=A0AAN6WWG4_9PEZI|nr:hypothetical protein QBC35DRAFT_498135 [Podospora australis]